MTMLLLVAIKIAVGVLILAIGMSATLADLTYLLRRPSLLLRSFLAMYLMLPIAAYLLVLVLPVTQGVKAAMLVLAVSGGAPLLPRKLKGIGNQSYVFSLIVMSSLLAIVMVPGWISLLARHFEVETHMAPIEVGLIIAKSLLLPLLAGMALRALAPGFSERVSDLILKIAGLVMTLAGLALLVDQREILLAIRGQGLVAFVLLMLIAVAIGHVLGGPEPQDRTSLAIACATRHIGVAVVVAATFPGTRTLVLLIVYVLAAALVSIPYLVWRRRQAPPAINGVGSQ